jgi:hypothetical protein
MQRTSLLALAQTKLRIRTTHKYGTCFFVFGGCSASTCCLLILSFPVHYSMSPCLDDFTELSCCSFDSFRLHYMINLVHVITDKPEMLHVHDTISSSPFVQTNALFLLWPKVAWGIQHSAFSLKTFIIHMHTIRMRIHILFISNLLPSHNIHGLCASLLHDTSCILLFSFLF